jgi:hypothetical protein
MVQRIASQSWATVVEKLIGAAGLVVTALYDLRVEQILPPWLDVMLLLGTLWVLGLVLVSAGSKLAGAERAL